MSRGQARRASRPPGRRQRSPLARFFESVLWREIRSLLLLATTALLAVSLLTYSAADPAPIFGAAGGSPQIHNAAGPVGAFLAAAAFALLGLAAYLLPVLTLLPGISRWAPSLDGWQPARLVGAGLLVVTLTGLVHLWFFRAVATASGSPGGLIGSLTGDWLAARLHGVGASIILLAGLSLALLFTTGLTLQAVARTTSRAAAVSGAWLRTFIAARREAWARRRRAARRSRRSRRPPEVVNPVDRAAPVTAPPPVTAPLPPVTPVVASEPEAEPEPFEAEQLAFSDLSEDFPLPLTSLLNPAGDLEPVNEEELVETARLLTAKLQEFGVGGSVQAIHPGPVITTFEFKPEAGVKYSRVTSLVDDLSLAMRAESVRIDRMVGRATIGVEVPNRRRQIIPIRPILESDAFQRVPGRLPLALGRTMDGTPYITPLERMPHLLIAGATGTGKSVALNAMITSILFRATPAEVKFIFIDPKMLELGIYDDIPHLICPVVTNPARAARALKWATREMTRRYETLFGHGVRNLEQYNRLVHGASEDDPVLGDDGEPLAPLPYIIIVIDELADLMMVSSKEVEGAIQRLAQMARAVGIHLIVATQRPSVDVLTGIIKANFPCRVAFRVSSRTDSNVVLDQKGAERLLGLGDMLFLPPGASRLVRVHGALVEEAEVRRVAAFLRRQSKPVFNEDVLKEDEEGAGAQPGPAGSKRDVLFSAAARLVVAAGQASVSHLQRRLSLGYARAARLMDSLEAEGIVGPPEGSKARKVLVPADYFEQFDETSEPSGDRAV
ncbi:MAG: DNA translocase FtsK 4TM domain-containing protein [Acidobacteriota bacterium]